MFLHVRLPLGNSGDYLKQRKMQNNAMRVILEIHSSFSIDISLKTKSKRTKNNIYIFYDASLWWFVFGLFYSVSDISGSCVGGRYAWVRKTSVRSGYTQAFPAHFVLFFKTHTVWCVPRTIPTIALEMNNEHVRNTIVIMKSTSNHPIIENSHYCAIFLSIISRQGELHSSESSISTHI